MSMWGCWCERSAQSTTSQMDTWLHSPGRVFLRVHFFLFLEAHQSFTHWNKHTQSHIKMNTQTLLVLWFPPLCVVELYVSLSVLNMSTLNMSRCRTHRWTPVHPSCSRSGVSAHLAGQLVLLRGLRFKSCFNKLFKQFKSDSWTQQAHIQCAEYTVCCWTGSGKTGDLELLDPSGCSLYKRDVCPQMHQHETFKMYKCANTHSHFLLQSSSSGNEGHHLVSITGITSLKCWHFAAVKVTPKTIVLLLGWYLHLITISPQ